MELTKNRAELAVLRGKRSPEHMALWVQAFAEGDEALAARYAIAVATFLGDSAASGEEWASYVGKLSPRTREAYAFAVTEFFEWAARKHGEIVPPHKVLRKDAEDYANWLSNRPFSLTEEKLNDFDQERRRTVYETVAKVGPADRRSIYGALPASMKPDYTLEKLTHTLGRMVLHDLLDRSPTLSQIRVDHPRAGIDQNTIMIPGPDPEGPWVPMELADVFQYMIPRPRGVSRSTIALRLSALSTFWDVLAQGENIPGGQAIIQHNIFKGMKKRVTRGLSRERKASSAARRMDPSLVPRLLNAANLAKTLPEKRDKALLYFLVFTGSRLSEAVNLRRGEPPPSEINRWPGWFVGNTEPPVVRVRRKGGKLQSLPFPPVALRALADFQADLDRRSAPLSAQSSDPKAPHYLHANSPRWRYRELARASDAPLFPPVHFWGANSSYNYQQFKPNAPNTYGPPTYRRSMSKAGVYKLLVRLAHRAGLIDAEIEQIHPHALRHFAATAMAKGGKDLREIQAILGHESVTTTEGYLADIENVVALSGQAEILEYLSQFEGSAEAVPPPPPHAPKAPPKREVIETYGIPAPEAPSRPPREQEPQVPGQPRPRPPRPPKAKPEAVPGVAPAAISQTVQAAAQAPPASPVEEESLKDIAPAYVPPEELPPHAVAVFPKLSWPEISVAQTASGRVTVYREPIEDKKTIIAVEGEPVPEEVKAEIVFGQVRDKQSPASPDEAYRDDSWERIEFTMMTPRKPGDEDLVTLELTGGEGGAKRIELVQLRTPEERAKRGSAKVPKGAITKLGHEFLATFYDPWPQNYGLGTVSLLPWFTKAQVKLKPGAPLTAEDPVTGKQVEVPILPVLAPEQVLDETTGSVVLDGLEKLYELWLNGDPSQGVAPSPSRTFGLVRWYGFFAYTTGALQAYLRDKKKEYDDASRAKMGLPVPNVPTWVAWNAPATVGANVRAHKDEWVLAWFQENAHTFTATRGLYEKEMSRKAETRPGGVDFERAFASVTARSVALSTTLPEWFADDDPVRAIYDRDPKEWDRFATWLANITGQKIGAQRREARADAVAFAEKSWEEKREEAKELFKQHSEVLATLMFINQMRRGKKPVLPSELEGLGTDERTKKGYEEFRLSIVKQMKALGMPDPLELAEVQGDEAEAQSEVEKGKKRPPLTPARVNELIEKYFPAPPEEENANILRGSTLFDARLLNIDYKQRTITHTPEYRELFAQQYDKRDSELVMRRTARAMWEYAKSHGQVEKDPKRGYSALYSVMLSYIAWIVPSPPEMERASIEAGRVERPGKDARRSYLTMQARLLFELAYGSLRLTSDDLRDLRERRAALQQRGVAEEKIEARLITEQALRMVQRAKAAGQKLTDEEARTAIERLGIMEQFAAPMEAVTPAQATEIAAQIAEGGMVVHATREEAERERERYRGIVRRRKKSAVAEPATAEEAAYAEVAPVRVIMQAGKLKANLGEQRATFEYLPNDKFDAWYCVRLELEPPEGQYAPNRKWVKYVTPAAHAYKQSLLANMRQAMPSPLRMIAAMNLSAIESVG